MTSNQYFKELGIIELGDMTLLYSFLNDIQLNLYKIKTIPARTPFILSRNLDAGSFTSVIRYGPVESSQFIFESTKLKSLFPDWASLQKSYELLAGIPFCTDFPRILYTPGHTWRHTDQRSGAVNVGLWQCDTATTCFWEGRELVANFNMDIGQAYLLNTEKCHSVVMDDFSHTIQPRAILTWDIAGKYKDIK